MPADGAPRHRRPIRGWRWRTAGVLALLALWEAGHLAYGDFVLPSPVDSLMALVGLGRSGRLWPAVLATTRDAFSGFLLASLAGLALGALAGASRRLSLMLQPIATTAIGVPSIAWVVLALLWFGGSGLAAVFTVAVATTPLIFGATAEGVASLDGGLRTMARSFRVPLARLVADVYAPHLLSHVFPALVAALAMSWKIAVMAELLAGAGGIGDGLAAARAEVDTAETMAWIIVVVVLLIAAETLVLDPVRRHVETWRRELVGATP
jgi:NitT/TauT family transport system permease protein